MTPPPYVLSQGVLAAIGNALSHAFPVGIGAFHEASKPHDEARPWCPPLESDPKHNVQVRVMLGLLLRANGVCVSSLECANIIQSWNHAVLGLLDSLPYDEEVVVWGK
jgi:hypothetical protein